MSPMKPIYHANRPTGIDIPPQPTSRILSSVCGESFEIYKLGYIKYVVFPFKFMWLNVSFGGVLGLGKDGIRKNVGLDLDMYKKYVYLGL